MNARQDDQLTQEIVENWNRIMKSAAKMRADGMLVDPPLMKMGFEVHRALDVWQWIVAAGNL